MDDRQLELFVPKIKVTVLSDKDLLCSLDVPDEFLERQLHQLPQRRWSARYQGYTVPMTEPNVDALKRLHKTGHADFDEEAELVVKHFLTQRAVREVKARRRAEFIYADEAPAVDYYKFGTKPYKHQLVGFDSSIDQEAFALLMEMGTGKTKIVVDRACYQAQKLEAEGGQLPYRVLVICPKSVMGVWEREFRFHASVPYAVSVLRGGKRKRVEKLVGLLKQRDEAKVLVAVVNYEGVRVIAEELQMCKFHLCVADESTRIKNPRAKRSRFAVSIARSANTRMILTGSPITKSPLDLYMQFEFLQDSALGFTSYYAFKDRYAIFGGYQGRQLIQHQNMRELQDRVARLSFIVKKAQCMDLPPKLYTVREVQMTPDQVRVYEQMRTMLAAELEADEASGKLITANHVLTKLLRLAQITSGFAKFADGTVQQFKKNPKADETVAYIEDLPLENKVIVWCRFREDIAELSRRLYKKRIDHVVFHGGVRDAERERAIHRFNTNDNCRVFIGQPQSGGLGITLLGYDHEKSEYRENQDLVPEVKCTHVIYYSNDFALEPRVQSEDRCHRGGLRSPVTYVDMLAGPIDELIVTRLVAKRDLAEEFTDVKELIRTFLGKPAEYENGNGNGDDDDDNDNDD